jgi:hypothetical protein
VSGSSESGAIGLDKAAPYQALWIGREELAILSAMDFVSANEMFDSTVTTTLELPCALGASRIASDFPAPIINKR